MDVSVHTFLVLLHILQYCKLYVDIEKFYILHYCYKLNYIIFLKCLVCNYS